MKIKETALGYETLGGRACRAWLPHLNLFASLNLLAACLGVSTRSPAAACSQTCQSQQGKRGGGRLGDSGGSRDCGVAEGNVGNGYRRTLAFSSC